MKESHANCHCYSIPESISNKVHFIHKLNIYLTIEIMQIQTIQCERKTALAIISVRSKTCPVEIYNCQFFSFPHA